LGIAKQFPSTGSAYRPYADEYRELAEQRLAFAAAAWRIEAKTAWVALALKWQRLAEKAEKLAKQQPQEACYGIVRVLSPGDLLAPPFRLQKDCSAADHDSQVQPRLRSRPNWH
jgi:hypothetical protein